MQDNGEQNQAYKDRVWLKPYNISSKNNFHFFKVLPEKNREFEKSKKFPVFPLENYDVSIQD